MLKYVEPEFLEPMAKITINVPQHKLRSFLDLTRKLGVKRNIIHADKSAAPFIQHLNMQNVRKRISPFLLFDWEFFSNELEFE